MAAIRKELALASVTALAWTFWSIISDIVVSINSHTVIAYLTVVEIAAATISVAIFVGHIILPRRPVTNDDLGLVKYPIISAVCFGVGTIIYYNLIGNQNYPLVSSSQFGYIIVLALLINRIKKEPLRKKYLIGTIIVVVGFVVQSLALSSRILGAQ